MMQQQQMVPQVLIPFSYRGGFELQKDDGIATLVQVLIPFSYRGGFELKA